MDYENEFAEMAKTLGKEEPKETPEEKPQPKENEEVESEETETEEVEESEDEEEEESKKPLSSKHIPISKFREVKKEKDEAIAESQKKDTLIKELQDKLEQQPQKPAVDDAMIAEAASRIGVTKDSKEQLKIILDLVEKGTKVPDKFQNDLKVLQDTISDLQDEKQFGALWETYEPSLEKNYPNSTPSQLREAKKAMDELSHAPQFADKEIDYVFYKNKDIFDEIFATQNKKTFESKDNYTPPEDGEKEYDISKPADLVALHDALRERADKEDSFKISNPVGF